MILGRILCILGNFYISQKDFVSILGNFCVQLGFFFPEARVIIDLGQKCENVGEILILN